MTLRRVAPVALVLLLLAVTFLAALVAWRAEVSGSQDRAREAAQDGATLLESNLRAAGTALNDGAGLFVASRGVAQPEFADFARQVLDPSGLTSIGWIERVPAAQRAAFEMRTGLSVVEPAGPGRRLVPAAPRPVYHPLTHVESRLRPKATLGTDVGADPARRVALEGAIASGQVRITSSVALLGSGRLGVIAYQPAFRGGGRPRTPAERGALLMGMAIGSFAFDSLLAPLLAAPPGAPRIDVMLEGSDLTPAGEPLDGAAEATVAFGGRQFTVVAERPDPSPVLPLVILALGCVVASLAGVLASVLARRADRQDRAVREATSALRASRESHRALVENSPDVISRYDAGLRCVYMSPSIAAGTGRAPGEYLGLTPDEMDLSPGLAGRWTAALADARDRDRDTRFDFSFVTEGATLHFEARITPEHGPGGDVVSLLATVRDVTALRDIADELQRSRDYAEALVDSMHDGLIVLGPGGVLEHVNQRLLEMTGFTREELIGSRPPFPFHPPEEIERIRRVLRDYLDAGGSGEFELQYRRRDGTRFPVLLGASPLRDADGTLVGGVRLVRDITSTRAAEQALRASEERHRSLVEAMADGVVMYAPNGTVVDCNPAAERILGRPRELLVGAGMDVWDRGVVREDGSPVPVGDTPPAVALRTGAPQRHVLIGLHRADGSLVWLDVSCEPLADDGPRGVVATFTDVTERLEAAREQASLRHLATLVAAEAEPRRVFDSLAREAARAADADGAGVMRFEDGRRRARGVGAWSVREGAAATGRALAVDHRTVVGRVGISGTAERADAPEDGSIASLIMPEVRITSSVGVPIVVNGEVWGALAVASTRGRPFPPSTEERLARLSEIATLAITGSDARAQLATLASTDHLTGLWNRRAFEDRLALELGRARRYDRGLGLVLMDIDHFKLVNDTHGHPAGDRVLVEFAARLREVVRGGETIARVGGEEFAWILPEVSGEDLVLAAERLRRAVVAEPFPDVGRLTVSAGVCGLDDAPPEGDLFRLADVAMYWAKAQGRNRVFRYSAQTIAMLPADEQERRLERARSFASVEALARAVDAKDPLTQRHSERVAAMARRLAISRGWSAERADRLHQAALVHDVGKIAIPDAILFAARPLTDEEYARVREHTALGAAMLQDALSPEQVSWVRGHHERPDGGGYPDGLSADAIPEGAALLALADAWDAMTVARPYGAPRSVADARRECERLAGVQFERRAVDALLAVLDSGADAPADAAADAAEAAPA